MSHKIPRLRQAMSTRDVETVCGLARDLRNTVSVLGLPRLFQMSQDIEYRRQELARPEWDRHCDRFCDLLERVQYNLQRRLSGN
ncbi:MAG TPA: hypothetical protein VHC95_12020 [Opitutales bacterium]|nr:hypothetical protein [Opitutales bacterium]